MRRWFIYLFILSLVILFYAGMHMYLGRRLILSLGVESKQWLWAIRIALVFLATAYIAARLLAKLHTGFFTVSLTWIGSVWWGIALYLIIFSMVTQFSSALINLIGMNYPSVRAVSERFGLPGFTCVVVLSIIMSAYSF